MSEKQQLLENLQGPMREIQGFPWTAIARAHGVRTAAKAGCLVNAYQRLTPKALNELSAKELGELLELTKRFQSALNQARPPARGEYSRDDAQALQKECEGGLPVVLEFADGTAANKAKRKEAEALLAEMRAHLGNAESILDAIRKAAGEAGVSQQAIHFKEEADRHEAEAKTWRERVGMAVAAFVGAAFLSWWWSGDVADGFALAQSLASRALVFVALGFGVFFCAKNYLAHRHNAVVNRHRQKALETYRALAEADPKSREIVLAHAARCIYAPQDSGFARKGESGGGEIPIETILRLVKGKEDS